MKPTAVLLLMSCLQISAVGYSKRLIIGHGNASEIRLSPTTLIELKGKVVNELGQGMIGVSVVVKGSSNGTMTDGQGIFSINASKNDILVFSYVDYESKEVVVGDAELVNVQLSPMNRLLNEVVLTALNINKQKKALGYSSQEVKGDVLAASKQSNLVNALQGKVAGVQINSGGG